MHEIRSDCSWIGVLSLYILLLQKRLIDGLTSLALIKKAKSLLQLLPFLLIFWDLCDIFSLLSQAVARPNPSVFVSGSQDLLGALNKSRPSHGIYGRRTSEWQGLYGEKWHQCQWGSFSAIFELGMLSNARLILTLMENGGCQDRMGWGRRISTHRCEQSNQSERSQFLCSSEKYIILFEEHCPVGCRAKEIFKETVKDDHVLTLKTPMICSRIEVPVTLKEQLKFLIFFMWWILLLRQIWKIMPVAKHGQLHSPGEVNWSKVRVVSLSLSYTSAIGRGEI